MGAKNTTVIIFCLAYFVILICIGFWAKKRNTNIADFLVAGRKVGILMTATTVAAVQVGAGIVLGGASTGASLGLWPGMYYALGCGLGCIVGGIFVAKKLRQLDGVVPMDYFEIRFGKYKAVRFWAWLSNVPSLLGIFVAQLLACGSILAAFGVPFWLGVSACAVVILIYSSIGGMWAVIMGDLIHVGIMIIGIPLAAIIIMTQVGATGVSVSSLFLTPFIPTGMLTKFIYLVTPFLVAIAVSYDAYMRYQSAKDAETAKWGMIYGGILAIIFGIFASAIGVGGHILYPTVTSGVFANTIASSLSPVMAGIVIAAALGACMSSGNGLLLCLSASFSRDLYNKILHPDAKLEDLPHAKKIAVWTVVIACLAGIGLAMKMTSILDAIIIFNYPYMGSMLVPLLAGILYPGATTKGCFGAMIVGGVIGVSCFLAGIPGPLNNWVNPDMGLFVAYAASLIVLVIISKWDKNGNTKIELNEEIVG